METPETETYDLLTEISTLHLTILQKNELTNK